MGTFSSIQTRVNQRVIDLPTAVTAEVPTLVNEAIKELMIDHNFACMSTASSFTTTVNTSLLGTVPANFKEYRGQPYALKNLGGAIKIKVENKSVDMFPDIQTTDIGSPQVLLNNDAGSYFIYPLPDGASDYSDGEYRIVVPYWKLLADLSAGTDTNWFTVNAERFIVEWATAQAHNLDWDDERMAIELQKSEVEKKRVIKRDKMYRLSGVTELAIHKDVYDSNLRT